MKRQLSQLQRLDYIDSIRGIACIMVYLCHMFDTILGGHPNYLGKVGVCFLFALSGYCNMEIYHKYGWTWKKLIYFYTKRLCSIYPCLLIALGLAYLSSFWPVDDVINILALRRGKGHFWSMSVILIFYIIFPILSILIQKLGDKTSMVILWIGLIVWIVSFKWLEVNCGEEFIFMFVPECIAGMLVFLHKEQFLKKELKKSDYKDVLSIIPVITFAFGGFVVYSVTIVSPLTAETLKYVVGTVVCSVCFYYVATRNHVKEFLDGKWFAWLHYLGRISYQFYLVHYVILVWMVGYTSWLAPQRAIVSEIVVSVGATLILSEIMYTYVQQPINRFVKRLSL